jgi:hypothetical protein
METQRQRATAPEPRLTAADKIQRLRALDYLDLMDSAWEGWPGIRSPEAKDYLIKHQITAEGWFVAEPDLTLAEIQRLKRIGKAVDEFLDKIG